KEQGVRSRENAKPKRQMKNLQCKSLMIQGTGSSVGKSLIAAALCRLMSDRGVNVTPFKAQNMSLNAFATAEAGEISRAQAFQAEAARVEPSVLMNPVLLKPMKGHRCQIILNGKVWKSVPARSYKKYTAKLF